MIKTIFAFLLTAFMLTAFVVADNVTNEEVSSFQYNFGAEVRFSQLENSIEKNIIVGNEVIEKLNDSEIKNNATAIIQELEVLLEQIQDINYDSNESLVSLYVELKKESIDLTSEFRKLVSNKFSNDEKQEIKEQTKEQLKKHQEERKQYFEQLRNNYNAEAAKQVAKKLGLKLNETTIEKVKNGQANLNDVRKELQDNFKEQSKEKRQEIQGKLKEQQAKLEVLRKATAEKIENQIRNTIQEKIASRIEEIKEKRNLSSDNTKSDDNEDNTTVRGARR